ncbi:hypothetical protein B296_00039258 [Ensete ventricosum]|uniref:Uncharacterized protein n=1 Tax=Ensete ventricosum TaxID=4639 RepID=A0A426ZQY2_ENSVE|nr:hypothetical protein B296_00039258 [Ensete ventricosum]
MASVLFAEVQFLPLPSFAGRPSARPPSLLLLRHRQDRFGLLGGHPSPSLLRGSFVARVGPATYLPDFEAAEGLARELFGRVEGLVYTVADAAVASSDAAAESSKQSGDWLSGITYYLETVLKVGALLNAELQIHLLELSPTKARQLTAGCFSPGLFFLLFSVPYGFSVAVLETLFGSTCVNLVAGQLKFFCLKSCLGSRSTTDNKHTLH